MFEKITRYLLKNQVIFALVIIALVWFIIQVRGIFLLFFLAYIIMAALLPFVSFFKHRKFPHVLSVLIPYLGVVVVIVALIFPLVPFFVSQIQALLQKFPELLHHSANIFGITIEPKQLQSQISPQLDNLSRNAFDVTTKLFGGVFSIFTVLIVSFYLLFYHDQFKHWFIRIFDKETRPKALITLHLVEDKLGAWMRGQILLSFFIGAASWIALSLLGVPYALPLALMAGMFEVLPTLGPILSAIPAIIVALTISTGLALTVVGLYIVIQFIEGHILVPNIMQRAVGLNPVFVILAIMIGANLMGIPGALLAIPFLSFVIVLLNSAVEFDKSE